MPGHWESDPNRRVPWPESPAYSSGTRLPHTEPTPSTCSARPAKGEKPLTATAATVGDRPSKQGSARPREAPPEPLNMRPALSRRLSALPKALQPRSHPHREQPRPKSRWRSLQHPRPLPHLRAGTRAPGAGTHGAAEAQEQPEDLVLREGGVPGHQVDEAPQRPPPRLDELPVRCRRARSHRSGRLGRGPPLSTRQPRGRAEPPHPPHKRVVGRPREAGRSPFVRPRVCAHGRRHLRQGRA